MKKAVFKIITSCIVGTSLFFSPQLATKSYATLTVRTYMDTTETAIYGIPTTFTERRPAIESRIETYFSARNISVNVTSSNLDIYSTPASQCAENAPNYNYTVRHGCACTQTHSVIMGLITIVTHKYIGTLFPTLLMPKQPIG